MLLAMRMLDRLSPVLKQECEYYRSCADPKWPPQELTTLSSAELAVVVRIANFQIENLNFENPPSKTDLLLIPGQVYAHNRLGLQPASQPRWVGRVEPRLRLYLRA